MIVLDATGAKRSHEGSSQTLFCTIILEAVHHKTEEGLRTSCHSVSLESSATIDRGE